MIEGTLQNPLSIEELVSSPREKNRASAPSILEDPWPSGSTPLPVVGRFPDLDRIASMEQDRERAVAAASGGHGKRAAGPEKAGSRHGRWISQKRSAQVLGAAGLLLLFAAIALFPHSKSSDESDATQAAKTKPSAPPAAIVKQPAAVQNSPLPGALPRIASAPSGSPAVNQGKEKSPIDAKGKLERTAGAIAGKTGMPLPDAGKTIKPNEMPALQVADRRSGIGGNVPTVVPALPENRPAPQTTVNTGEIPGSGGNGDFEKWPRPTSNAGGGSGIPSPETNPRGAGSPPVPQTPPPAPRVSVLRNPYI
jgi:hypothetical protein